MVNMRTLTVTLETVTPLFLGGAEPRGTPELRPPAFRGALRYWLRAALGGVIGDKNLAGLHQLESAVFGSTDYGSSIQVRLRNNPQGHNLQASSEKILPHKEGSKRQALSAGQRFDLSLSQIRNTDESTWQAACSALNLVLIFGGVGLRSRRGHGTLRVVQSSDPVIVPLTPSALGGWKELLQQVTENAIASARNLAQSQNAALMQFLAGPARYPCVTQSGLIRICQPSEQKSTLAMDAVTQFMQKASGSYAFGGIKPRQASPLWVRPIRLGEQYGLLFMVLASDYPGANYETVRSFLDKEFPGEDIPVKGWNA
jgi:CRISPR-associated protein Cmr1